VAAIARSRGLDPSDIEVWFGDEARVGHVWPAPFASGFVKSTPLISLLQRIRPRRHASGQDGDPRDPVLIRSSALMPCFSPGFRTTVRLSLSGHLVIATRKLL
jgi:hypothetical protein